MSEMPPKHAPGLHTRPSHQSRTSTATLGAPDGAIGEEAAELLEEFAGTHQHYHDAGDGGPGDESELSKIAGWKKIPWWKRPSPWWYVGLTGVLLRRRLTHFVKAYCRSTVLRHC